MKSLNLKGAVGTRSSVQTGSRELAEAGLMPQKVEATSEEVAQPTPKKEGGKADYVRATITLPPAMYEALMAEKMRRKLGGKGGDLSSLVREALTAYLSK